MAFSPSRTCLVKEKSKLPSNQDWPYGVGVRRSMIGLGRDEGAWARTRTGISFSRTSKRKRPLQRVTSRQRSPYLEHKRAYAPTSVSLQIPILPDRNFAHWAESSNSLASTGAVSFFLFAPKEALVHFHRWVIGPIFLFAFSFSFLLVHDSCQDAMSFLCLVNQAL